MKTCSICPNPYYAKGFCKKHYTRQRVHGDPAVKLNRSGQQANRLCYVCGAPATVRGLCLKHHKRLQRHGDPTIVTRAAPGEHFSFLMRAVEYAGDDCLLWPYGRQKAGYGAVTGRAASNMLCEIAHGPAPEDKPEAAHSCHNKLCVNPKHLTWASHAENMAMGNKHQPNTDPRS